MWGLIATAVFFLNGVPQGDPVEIRSREVFSTLEECQMARPAPQTVVVVGNHPARIETVVCARFPDNPDEVDLLSDTLRRMIQGGGFGALNN